jgi:lycopene cyclase domain-containing protein
LVWTLPLLAALVCLAPELIWKQVVLVALVTGFGGSYYTWTDVQAVKAGVWFFDEAQITGWKWRGILPWEEAAFFYLTSTLVAVSYLLLLPSALR